MRVSDVADLAALQVEIERIKALWEDADGRNLWRRHRLKAQLQVLEAQLPPPPNPVPKIQAIPFAEYAVAKGAEHTGTLPPMAPDRPVIPRYKPPVIVPSQDVSDYDVRPGAQMKGGPQ